jgi:hypothetical protein
VVVGRLAKGNVHATRRFLHGTLTGHCSQGSAKQPGFHVYTAKCGFVRIASDPIVGSPDGEYVYRKDIVKSNHKPASAL